MAVLKEDLLKLFELVQINNSFGKSAIVASKIIKHGYDLSPSLESILVDFLIKMDGESFVKLSKEVLYQNLLESYSSNLRLIVFLAKDKLLPLKDIAFLLSSIPYSERSKLKDGYKQLVEIADLIYEDMSEGIMDVSDDDLLLKALAQSEGGEVE